MHLLLREMSCKYGDVFKLQLGSKVAVVLSSRKVMKEAYVKQAKTFAGRPNLPTFECTRNGQTGLSLCNYSSEYKSNNRIVGTAIHNFLANENNLDELLKGEATKMIRLFDKYSASKKCFPPFEEFRKIVPSLFVSLMFRRQYDYDDPVLNTIGDAYKTWFDVAEADNPADFFPFMLYLPNDRLNIAKNCGVAFESFSMSMIEQFENICMEDDYDEDKGSLFDVLVMQYTNRNKTPLTFTEKQRLAKILSDLLGGGFDTAAASLSWAMLYLTNQPEILQKCRAEINQNIIGEELSINKKNTLPYFSATIYEIFRLSTVAPLGIARQVTKDTTLMGYNIPKDTMVLANLWQMNHDPDRWEVPESIHPEHFLTEDCKLDYIIVRELMTFSAGIRQCPGKQMAFYMVFILLGSIIRHYDITIVEKPEDMIPQRGLTLKPKYCTMSLSKIST